MKSYSLSNLNNKTVIKSVVGYHVSVLFSSTSQRLFNIRLSFILVWRSCNSYGDEFLMTWDVRRDGNLLDHIYEWKKSFPTSTWIHRAVGMSPNGHIRLLYAVLFPVSYIFMSGLWLEMVTYFLWHRVLSFQFWWEKSIWNQVSWDAARFKMAFKSSRK